MKKILFHLFLLASLFMAACHDDNGGPSSIGIDKDQQNQTAYADDTEKTIRFEATEAWHTEVDYTATKATETVEKWVSLDPASGEAGEITIKLALSTNYTGTDLSVFSFSFLYDPHHLRRYDDHGHHRTKRRN